MYSAPYSIHQLSGNDQAMMHGLLDMFGKAFELESLFSDRRPGEDYLRALLEGDSFIALAALKGDQVVGGLAAYELKKFEQPRSEIYVYDLAVDEAHRREGIATALLKTIRHLAAERGAYQVFIQADVRDGPAVALYETLGERLDVVHFEMPAMTAERSGHEG